MALTNVALGSHFPLNFLGTKQRSQALPSCPKPWQPEAGAYPYWHRSRSPQALGHHLRDQGNPLAQLS